MDLDIFLEGIQSYKYLLQDKTGLILSYGYSKNKLSEFVVALRYNNYVYNLDIEGYDKKDKLFYNVDNVFFHSEWIGNNPYRWDNHSVLRPLKITAFGGSKDSDKLINDDTIDRMVLNKKKLKNYHLGDLFVGVFAYFTISNLKYYKETEGKQGENIKTVLEAIVGRHLVNPDVNFNRILVFNKYDSPKPGTITTITRLLRG